MPGVAAPKQKLPKGKFIGVSFRRIEGGGTHVGLVMQGTKSLKVLQQNYHLKLTLDDALHEHDFVVRLSLPKARIRPTARYAERFFNAVGKGLPYNFLLPNQIFDEKKDVVLLGRGEGLTCATLVLAVLAATGLDLLRLDEWPNRAGDSERHQELIEITQEVMKRRNGGTLAPDDLVHLAYMKTQVGAVRFRPEEVAGSAGSPPYPVTFETAVEASNALLAEYDALFGIAHGDVESEVSGDADESDDETGEAPLEVEPA